MNNLHSQLMLVDRNQSASKMQVCCLILSSQTTLVRLFVVLLLSAIIPIKTNAYTTIENDQMHYKELHAFLPGIDVDVDDHELLNSLEDSKVGLEAFMKPCDLEVESMSGTVPEATKPKKSQAAAAIMQRRKKQRRRRKLGDKTEWITMKLIVEANTEAFRRLPDALARVPSGTINDFAQGDLLIGGKCESTQTCTNFGNNNMFRRDNPDVPIGVTYQTCITPTVEGKTINRWLCTWVIAFSDLLQNQIMAQGNYYRANVNPLLIWAPDFQFITITGGTGVFRSVTGFIIIAPNDLGLRPSINEDNVVTPTFYYYFVYKLF